MTGLNKQGVLPIKITDEKNRKIANLLLTEGGMTKKELHDTCFDYNLAERIAKAKGLNLE